MLLAILAIFLVASHATQPAPYAPTSSYALQEIDGHPVYVAKDLREKSPDLCAQALALLKVQIYQTNRLLPPAAAKSLRAIPVWLELDDPRFPGGVYHPSADWLRQQGLNPDKAGAVEFGNAKNFLSWSKVQPCILLHEFAHAYHDQVLGYSNPDVKAAFESARAHHLYDHVLRIDGRTERAYAMTNDREYFAESSETFFGTNDYYPFVCAELQQLDPLMLSTLQKLWGVKHTPRPTPATQPSPMPH